MPTTGTKPPSDLDVLRSAQILIRQHGARAAWEAAAKQDEMIARGDPAGEAVWNRVRRAILQLEADRKPGEALH